MVKEKETEEPSLRLRRKIKRCYGKLIFSVGSSFIEELFDEVESVVSLYLFFWQTTIKEGGNELLRKRKLCVEQSMVERG